MVKKISIIGSGGVGATLAFDVLAQLKVSELALVDVNRDLAQGVALDLEDTRGFLNFSTKIRGDSNFSIIKNSDIIVVTAGIARKKGMSRLDLLKINSDIGKDIARKIKKLAPDSIVIVVTNPLDVMTRLFIKNTGFSRLKVFGMGSSLDTARLYNILHKTTGVCTSSFSGCVYGPHSKDMIVNLNRIKIEDEDLSKLVKKNNFRQLKSRVQLRGAEIVDLLKNKSANFAPALACCKLIEAIAFDKNEVIPVSVLLKGEYGLHDICLGAPCIINRKGIANILKLSLSASELKELRRTASLLKNV
ncbi:MAG: malate dehydrogenase [Candidatus Omnitrophica bacterium]|jgi:malate dehydrogenase|nr:malate dehydrogenase [Candidatus Omnitrophota bacterium]